ncbi:MAG: hypothetical protein JHC95_14430 [Solirubrobacteraceae bacterium]|nr:hypothetical protein [Solirubrobacteraceae bacterium]
MRTTTAALTLAAALALPATAAHAYSDDLDPTYGTNGRTALAAGNEYTEVDDALEHDGKVVISGLAKHNGERQIYIARVDANGSPDATFGSGGKTLTDLAPGMWEGVSSVERQTDGRYLVAGYSDALVNGITQHRVTLVRYNANGSLDNGKAGDSTPGDEYGVDGIVKWLPSGTESASAWQMVLDADGKAMVVASTYGDGTKLQRFTTTGALSGATVNAPVNTAIGEEEIVRSGTDYYALTEGGAVTVYKLNSSLQLVTGWGTSGHVTFPNSGGWSAMDMDQAPDGDLVIAGSFGGGNAAVTGRVDVNGTIDTAYGGKGTGMATLDLGRKAHYFQGIDVMSTGRIVLSGYWDGDRDELVVSRLLANGTPDPSFGAMGSVIAGALPQDTKGVWGSTPFVDGNGRILVAAEGTTTASVSRATTFRFVGGYSPRRSGTWRVTPDQAPIVGDTLTCDPGAFGANPTYQFQWYRNSGQTLGTSQTEKATQSLVGQVLWCELSASYGNDLHSPLLVTPLTEKVANPPAPPKPAPQQPSTPKPVVQQPVQQTTTVQQQGTTTTTTTPQRPFFNYRLGTMKVRKHRLQIKLTLPSAGRVRVAGKSGKTTVFVVTKRLSAGTRTLDIGLNAKGRKILRKKAKVRVKLTISGASNAGVPGSTITTTITIK